jgi:hypothetical protein
MSAIWAMNFAGSWVGVNLVIYPKTLRAGSVLKIEERLNKVW